MGRKIPIIIGELKFDSKEDALEHYKVILNNYGIKETLNDEDFEQVYHLLRNHPRVKEKIGCGIDKIIVDEDGYKKRCFHLCRKDGIVENFSYIKCVKGESNDFTNFSKACRKAVEEDIRKVKENYFMKDGFKQSTAKCDKTHELITFEEAHVDHRQPMTFSVIVDFFIEINNIDLKTIAYNHTGTYGNTFEDEELAKRFREYHAKKANLRIVKGANNLSRSYQARIHRQKKDIQIPS